MKSQASCAVEAAARGITKDTAAASAVITGGAMGCATGAANRAISSTDHNPYR